MCHLVQGDMMTKRQLLLVLAGVVALWCQRGSAVTSTGTRGYVFNPTAFKIGNAKALKFQSTVRSV